MTETIVLGGGCFWCLEATYYRIRGVVSVESGYAGGETHDPTYEAHGDHAEVVKIQFDTKVVHLEDLLDVFWIIHDPTSLNKQGADVGTSYRSIVLYDTESQREKIMSSIQNAQQYFDKSIVTEVGKLNTFYPAEEYHRNYYDMHPEAVYCQVVINPKLAKLKSHFSELMK